jgi:hypothetical protein
MPLIAPATRTSGGFLALAFQPALAGYREPAFGWIVGLLLPSYLPALAGLLLLQVLVSILTARPWRFLWFGALPAAILGGSFLSTGYVPPGKAVILTFSVLVPFAAVQFLLSLVVRREALPE